MNPSPLDNEDFPEYDPKEIYGRTLDERLSDYNDHVNKPDISTEGQKDIYGPIITEDDHE